MALPISVYNAGESDAFMGDFPNGDSKCARDRISEARGRYNSSIIAIFIWAN